MSRGRRDAGDSGPGGDTPAPLVLIVEDDPDTREMYSMYLTTQGMRVLVASDGLTAVRMAVASRPDVIVMDLSLPTIDGMEAIRRVRRHKNTARIPIIACTGRVEGGTAESAIDAGCDAFVLKPCLPDALLVHIRVVLARAQRQRHA